MAVLETHLNLDAFKEMKKIIQEEMFAQNMSPDDVKREIEIERKKK